MILDPIVSQHARGFMAEQIEREMLTPPLQFTKVENDVWWAGMVDRISERLGLS